MIGETKLKVNIFGCMKTVQYFILRYCFQYSPIHFYYVYYVSSVCSSKKFLKV